MRSARLAGVLLVLGLVVCSLVWAQEPVDLKLALPDGWQGSYQFEGNLTKVAMSGQDMGVGGTVQADLTAKLVATEAGTGIMTLELRFANIKANLGGQNMDQPDVGPLTMKVAPDGQLVAGDTQGNPDFFAAGPLPLHVLAAPLLITRFKGEPVPVGGEWSFEDETEVPGLGKVKAKQTHTLDAVTDDQVTITSNLEATIPEFTATLPFLQNMQVKVTGGTLKVTDLQRHLARQGCALLDTQGGVTVEVGLDLGGMATPVATTMDVKLLPAKPEDTAGH